MSEAHTPTPWRIDGPSGTIWGVDNGWIGDWRTCVANAAFIVRAVNAHEALVAALRETLAVAERSETGGFADRARAAIKLAGEAQ